ncbi:MAG: DNA gyrase [Oscillospiraceae bacterium]|nr:DNA gyrase [Oscillospiraceae bacterium]
MSVTTETRRESYKAIKPLAGRRRDAILEVMGDMEMTATEIAEAMHIRGYTKYYERNFAAPRLTELKAAGKVKTVGKRICGKTGRMVAVWVRV